MGMTRKTLNKWVKALRSGEFTQARERLYDEYGNGGYCCLGVLATVCPVKGVDVNMKGVDLPNAFLNVVGLSEDTQGTLAIMNDGGWNAQDKQEYEVNSFKDIADWLETRYNKLTKEQK